jgi:hypothetical protein
MLRGRIGGLDGRRVTVAFLKILAASMAMGAAARLTIAALTPIFAGATTMVRALRVGVSIAVAIAVLAGTARLLRIAEFDEAFGRVLRRLRPAA